MKSTTHFVLIYLSNLKNLTFLGDTIIITPKKIQFFSFIFNFLTKITLFY